MSVRGTTAHMLRPTTPPDPTLTTRPVATTRTFTLQSFGPGAAPNIKDLVRKPEDVRAESDPSTYLNPFDAQYAEEWPDPIHRFLEEIVSASNIVLDDNDEPLPGYGDPTWGFYTFVTDYDADTLENIPRAMGKLVDLTRRMVGAGTTTAYADEALRRFKIDVVQDEEALSGASDDRVREEFRALLRGLNLLGEDGRIRGPARNDVCVVIDTATVCMLADLTFSEDLRADYLRLYEKTLKVVDAWWKRPETNISAYRGVDYCPSTSLGYFYMVLRTRGYSGAMEELWPMKKSFRSL
ncbi:uncharacterized protein BDV17DRAFT_150008 [Aspergillus undulatus]|uniref:uncharacterized protein n=1 Tax=Aspergillus undulatus TaxID=1810928 RepID=UPI003CCD5DC6